MAEVTYMVLRVDLGCDRCYRKIKKLLCKYPEIRDQIFNEKEDFVRITVVCCSPDRIRQKLICKGGKTIKAIEILVPEKPKPLPPVKPKEAEKPKPLPPVKPKEAEKPKPPPEKPVEAEKPKPPPEKPKEAEKAKPPPEKPKEAEKSKTLPPEKPKDAEKPKPKPDPPPKPVEKPPAPVAGYPQILPVAMCCKPCYELGNGGSCHHGHLGYGIPYQTPSFYDGYVRLVPSYEESLQAGSWSSGCRCNRSYGCRCEYFTEENPSCSIM